MFKYIEIFQVKIFTFIGAIPLYYHIPCEASYPVAEGSRGFLTMNNNLAFVITFI